MHNELKPYRVLFRAVVLAHLTEKLGAAEWNRLRALASDRTRYVDRNETTDLGATPETLLDVALCQDSISVQQTLVPEFMVHAKQIGIIEDQPVYYIKSQGIYLWGIEPINGLTLSLWITYPAYPPAW